MFGTIYNFVTGCIGPPTINLSNTVYHRLKPILRPGLKFQYTPIPFPWLMDSTRTLLYAIAGGKDQI